MVRLDLDLPLPEPLDAMAIRPRYAELIPELEWCEFKGLMAEIRAEAGVAAPDAAPAAAKAPAAAVPSAAKAAPGSKRSVAPTPPKGEIQGDLFSM
jgi:DNA polymerase-1